MNKNLNELNSDELKYHIDSYLNTFKSYAKNKNLRSNDIEFLESLDTIKKNLNIKNQNHIERQLSKILLYLIEPYDENLQTKASTYFKVALELAKKQDIFKPIIEKDDDIRNIICSNNIIRNKPINDAGDMEAALQLNTRETESMQYVLKNVLSLERNSSNIDLEDILSVYKKIKKGGKYVTDVTAIRDSSSHSKYRIEQNKIIFKNNKKGYDYYQEFTFK